MLYPPKGEIDSRISVASAGYSNTILVVVLAASFLAIAFAAWSVAENFRPTLNWDQWADLSFLINIKTGRFSISDLFSQVNEHRIFTSRLFFLIDALLFGYQNIFLVIATFTSHLLLGGLVASLWFDRTHAIGIRAAACVVGAALLVTIVQYENLLWGFQIHSSLVYVFGLLALIALSRACLPAPPPRQAAFLGLYLLFSALSVFSMANGLLIFGAAMMLVIFMRGGRSNMAVVVVSAVVLGRLYLLDYQRGHLDIGGLINTLIYACYFLGAPFAKDLSTGALLGATGTALLSAATLLGLWDVRGRRSMPPNLAVLTCFAGLALASAVATGIGRAAAVGLETAATARYATGALLFWLSLSGSAYWFASERLAWCRTGQSRNAVAAALLATFVLIVVRLDSDLDTQRGMVEWASRIDRTSMALVNNVEMTEGGGLDVLFVPVIKAHAGQLRKYGWNIFSPKEKAYTPPIHFVVGTPARSGPPCRGFVDSIIRLDNQRIALRGWLLAPSVARSPSWIFVLDELNGIIGYLLPLDRRPDLFDKFGAAAGNGYFGAVDFKRPISSGPLKISLIGVFQDDVERTCASPAEVNVPDYQMASYRDGPLQARAISGLTADLRGAVVTREGPPVGFRPLPANDGIFYTKGTSSSQAAAISFHFDVSKLQGDDLVIPIATDVDYDFPIDITGSSEPIESLKLRTLFYPVWKIWRFAIVPRARLPASGEVKVTVRIPDQVPSTGATVGAPFATPANPNRAALY